MADRIGQKIGDYQLIRLLGRGGFAEVYLAEQLNNNAQVAIKVLNLQLPKDDIRSFLNEARIIRLKHPHIVSLLDFNVEGNTPYIVMEYAPNGTLHQRHPRGTSLSLDIVTAYIKQIADALQCAHNENLIHRDVKPENMLLNQKNDILLSDFGIATIARNTQSRSTQDTPGTIYYMSPEQIEGKPCFASDQYALGIVTYEWLCGTFPFKGTNWMEIAHQHLQTPPPFLHEIVSSIPANVEQVVLRSLAKDPKQRFENILEFSNALVQTYEENLKIDADRHLQEQTSSPVPASPDSSSLQIGTAQYTYRGHNNGVSALAWSSDGNFIASSAGNSVHIWEALTGNLIFEHYGHSKVNAVSFSPDGTRIASAGTEGTLQIWDISSNEKIITLNGPLSAPNSKQSLPLWTGIIGYQQQTSKLSTEINALAWSPDGTYIAAASSDASIYMWNAAYHGDTPFFTYKKHLDAVQCLSWSPDGKYIASGSSDHTVHIWDPTSGKERFTYNGHSSAVGGITWLPDSQRISSVAVNQSIVHLWNATMGKPLRGYNLPNPWQKAFAWSLDGKRFATGDSDKNVKLWDVKTGDNLFTYNGHSGAINALAWSPNGTLIASASVDKTVQVWQAA